MPELPEVETLRRSLEARVLNRRIVSATVHRRDVITTPTDPKGGFARTPGARPKRFSNIPRASLLQEAHIASLGRHGKQLAICSDSGRIVLVHLGMTGQLLVVSSGERLAKSDHVHLTWRLDDGSRLVFRDPRRFGGLWTVNSRDDLDDRFWSRLGPDALTVTAAQLRNQVGSGVRSVKAALLDQRSIAGVGNIYADESLFRAGIDPRTRCLDVAGSSWTSLASSIRAVLREAVKARGSTLRDYVDASGTPGGAQVLHRVYGRSGRLCVSCSTVLASTRVAQRTTVWCPGCQPPLAGGGSSSV